jgi:hypothetical protein
LSPSRGGILDRDSATLLLKRALWTRIRRGSRRSAALLFGISLFFGLLGQWIS